MNRLTGHGMVWKTAHILPATAGPRLKVPFPKRTVIQSAAMAAPVVKGK